MWFVFSSVEMANVYWDSSESEVEYAYDLSDDEEEEEEEEMEEEEYEENVAAVKKLLMDIQKAIKNVYVQCKRELKIKMDLLDFLYERKHNTLVLCQELDQLAKKLSRLRFLYNNVKVTPNTEAQHGLLLDPSISVELPLNSEPFTYDEWHELLRVNYFCIRHLDVFCICQMSISMFNCVH